MSECNICFRNNYIYRQLCCCKNFLCFICNTELSKNVNDYPCPFCTTKTSSLAFILSEKKLYDSLFLSNNIEFSILEKEIEFIEKSNEFLHQKIAKFIFYHLCASIYTKPKGLEEYNSLVIQKENFYKLKQLSFLSSFKNSIRKSLALSKLMKLKSKKEKFTEFSAIRCVHQLYYDKSDVYLIWEGLFDEKEKYNFLQKYHLLKVKDLIENTNHKPGLCFRGFDPENTMCELDNKNSISMFQLYLIENEKYFYQELLINDSKLFKLIIDLNYLIGLYFIGFSEEKFKDYLSKKNFSPKILQIIKKSKNGKIAYQKTKKLVFFPFYKQTEEYQIYKEIGRASDFLFTKITNILKNVGPLSENDLKSLVLNSREYAQHNIEFLQEIFYLNLSQLMVKTCISLNSDGLYTYIF